MKTIFSEKKQMIKNNIVINLEIVIDAKESRIYANDQIIWSEHISRYDSINLNEKTNEMIKKERIKTAQNVMNELTNEEAHKDFKYFIGDDNIEHILHAIGSSMTFKETSEATSTSKYATF